MRPDFPKLPVSKVPEVNLPPLPSRCENLRSPVEGDSAIGERKRHHRTGGGQLDSQSPDFDPALHGDHEPVIPGVGVGVEVDPVAVVPADIGEGSSAFQLDEVVAPARGGMDIRAALGREPAPVPGDVSNQLLALEIQDCIRRRPEGDRRVAAAGIKGDGIHFVRDVPPPTPLQPAAVEAPELDEPAGLQFGAQPHVGIHRLDLRRLQPGDGSCGLNQVVQGEVGEEFLPDFRCHGDCGAGKHPGEQGEVGGGLSELVGEPRRRALNQLRPHQFLVGAVALPPELLRGGGHLDGRDRGANQEGEQQARDHRTHRRLTSVPSGPHAHPLEPADGAGFNGLAHPPSTEIGGELRRGREPLHGFLGKAAQADRLQIHRHPGHESRRRRGVLVGDLAHQLARIRPLENRPLRQQLVQNRAEAIHVARHGRTGDPAGDHLGRQVTRGADQVEGRRDVGLVLQDLGEAEVADVGLPRLIKEHVPGLEIAVQNAALMREMNRLGQRDHQLGDPHPLAAKPAEPLRKRATASQLHREERNAVRLAHLVDWQDPGMIERGDGARLQLKSLPHLRRSQLVRQ